MEILRTLVILIVCVEKFLVTALTCPAECKCRSNSLGENTVNCVVGGWSSFPTGLDSSVKYLYVSGIPTNRSFMTTLRKSDFQNTPNLLSLVISYSRVKTIETGAFSSLNKLRDLVLSNNEIQTVSADSFSGLSQLRTLDISGNRDCQIDETVFKTISSLEELNMGNMNLRKIGQSMFSSLTKLKVLKLHLNNIRKIRDDFINGLPVLETLDLNGNLLKGIPAEWKPKFQTMKQVHLSENPLQCNCQLLWLRELPMKFYSSRIDTSNIVCNGPDKVKFASFVNVPEKDFECIAPKVIKCEKKSYSTELNDRVVISCEYEGDPIPDIKWTRPDGLEIDLVETVQNQYEITENGTLVINGITTVDDGNWKVTAYNKTAEDHMDIVVNVIVTTPSTSTKPTTAVSTIRRTSGPSSQKSILLTTLVPSSKSTINPDIPPQDLRTHPQEYVDPTEGSVRDAVKTVIKEAGINWGLLIAAAAGGGTIVGVIFIIGMCCKKKQRNSDENQVEPFELDEYK